MKRILWRQLMMYGLRLGRGWEVNLNFSLVSDSVKQVRDQQQGFWRRVCVCTQSQSHVWLFVTPWSIVHQAPLSMRFPRQAYWSGLPFPSLGDLPNPGIEPEPPALAGRFFTAESSRGPERSWLSPFKFVLSKSLNSRNSTFWIYHSQILPDLIFGMTHFWFWNHSIATSLHSSAFQRHPDFF